MSAGHSGAGRGVAALRVRSSVGGLPKGNADLAQAVTTVDAAIAAAADYAAARMRPHAEVEAIAAAAIQVAEAMYPQRRLGAYAAAHAAKAAAEAIRAGEHATDAIAMEVVASTYGANRVALTGGTGGRLNDFTGNMVRAGIMADFSKLKALGGGAFRDLGEPIDVAESGPLGPLWPPGEKPEF